MAPGTGYVFEERFMWHEPGHMGGGFIEPTQHFENVETKRRLHNLVHTSGLIEALQPVRARPATHEELCRVHTARYVEHVRSLSADKSKIGHRVGEEVSMSPGGYEIAALAAGGSIKLVDAALSGGITNGYALTRPPGHHAESDRGMGFCVFNNVAVAAAHALDAHGLARVAVVDFDVHHGNGTQQIFWDDGRVLFISLHQDSNYPLGSGPMSDVGGGAGRGTTLNVPLPPGSGSGAYRAAFERLVVPALDAFAPQLILVSAGYDASFYDPLGAQMCSSEDYRFFTAVLRAAAERHCGGRLLCFHEGGYSPLYVPFCGLAVIEELAGHRTPVKDPLLSDVQQWGYQALQPWQDDLIRRGQEGPLALLQQRCSVGAAGTGGGAERA